MVSNIKMGIAQKIRTVFTESDYMLYTEMIEQGFAEPCFFVSLISQTQKQGLANRYKETYCFEVLYYPSGEGNKSEECLAVAEGLYELLEYVTVREDLLRGINLNSKIKEGVLHFYADYNIFAIREKAPETNMEEVIVYGETKQW